MKHLYLYGAIDRFNYGDLLLPVLLKEKLEKLHLQEALEVRVFGTVESDLSPFGALPTESLKAFYSALETTPAYVLVVGGEVLTPNWSTVYSHLHLPYHAWHAYSKKFKRINNLLSKYVLGGRGRRPFILNPKDLPALKGVLYNGVGGKRRGVYKRDDFRNLNAASYLSCRDSSVLNVLHKNLPGAELVPDSAIQMSELHSKSQLVEQVGSRYRALFQEDYVFFQISQAVANELGVENLATKLRDTAQKHRKKIVLCPIGTASGHDDHLALKQLKELLPEEEYVLIEDPGLWEIMGLIAHASLYIGGSLHGIITSMSFEVPYLFLRDRPKLVAYVETWGVDALKGPTTLQNWESRVAEALALELDILKNSREYQLDVSEKSFKKMVEILMSD